MTGLGEKMSTREGQYKLPRPFLVQINYEGLSDSNKKFYQSFCLVNMLMDGLEDHNGMVDYSKFIKRLMGEEADEDEQAAWEEKIAEQQERDRLAAFRNRF